MSSKLTKIKVKSKIVDRKLQENWEKAFLKLELIT